MGPLYGTDEGPINLHNTVTDWITGKTYEMGSIKVRPEEVRKVGKQILSEEQIKELEEQGAKRMGYEQVKNEKALYIHPVTKCTIRFD